MEIRSNAAVRTASLVWQPQAGKYTLTVICKATFRLVPGIAELDAEQENPNEDDNYWDDDPTRSLYAPSDLVPYKPRADVLLVGYAFAPRGEPTRSIVTRLLVGTVDKSIEVHGDRSWAPDGSLREGPRFARMPLRYERAGGGPDTPNPVGMRNLGTDAYGATPIPNLQPPGLHLHQRGEWVPPIGYGPIAPTWPARVARLGQKNVPWALHAARFRVPLPEGLDSRFFNAAPEDQQTATIRPNERIILENLDPDHPRLITNLPGFTLRASAHRGSGHVEPISLDCDTLWIDTNSGRCTVVWRGRLALAHPAETGRVVITMEEPRTSTSVAPAAAPIAAEQTFEDGPDEIIETQVGNAAVPNAVLPFANVPRAPVARPITFQPPPMPAAVPPAPPPPAPPPPASPWAMGAPKDKPDSAPRPPMPSSSFSAPETSRVQMNFSAAQLNQPPAPPPKPSAPNLSEAARRGVASASTAAAAATTEKPVETQATAPQRLGTQLGVGPAPAHEAMTLLWLDDAQAEKILRDPQWIKILSEAEVPDDPPPAPPADDEEPDYFADEPPPEEDEPEDVRRRKRVAKVLARGEPTDAPGLASAVTNAVTKHGTLEPPIMLAAGELLFPFDPWETLKALIIAATPTAMMDKKLKEVLEGVQEVAKAPGVERSTVIAEALVSRVREAFAQSNRQVGPGWLDTQAERMLIEGRCFQKRAVLGQSFLRCLLHLPGAEEGIPTYVPEGLSKTIPLVARMRVRVLAEVHPVQDQFETYPRALRVLALGRMVDLGARPPPVRGKPL